MSVRTSAARYAKALFDVGLQEKADLNRIGADLITLSELLATNHELMLASERSGVPDSARRALMEQVADRVGVAPQVKKLIATLAVHRKLNLVKDLASVYRERLLAHQNVVRAEVRSAAPLPPDKTRARQRRSRIAWRRRRHDREYGLRR
jgi:F0F1-type ATP synthase delta subunit